MKDIRKGLRRTALLIIVSILLTNLFSGGTVFAAKEQETQVIRVGFTQNPGFCESHEDGTHSGEFYDWLIEISKYTGWEYEFVQGNTADLSAMLDEGEVDLICGVYYMQEMEEQYEYPKYSTGSSEILLIKHADDNSIQQFDLNTISGKTIGVFPQSSNWVSQLQSFLDYHSLKCELRYFDTYEEVSDALDRQAVDLLLGGEAYLAEDHIVAAAFGGEAYYIVTGKGNMELLRPLDKVITSIYMANPNFAKEVHDAHFPSEYKNKLVLTGVEKQYIKNSPVIKVALISNSYPLNYIQSDERNGISVDMFALISQHTGLQFEFVYADNYQGMLDLVTSGEADIVGSFLDEESTAQSKNMIITKKYGEMNRILIKNKTVNYPDENLRVAVVQGREAPKNILPKHIVYFPNFEACVAAVEKGKADITFLPSAFLEWLMYQNYYTQITIVAIDDLSTSISIAMPKPVDVTLYSILNKEINSISTEEKESIITKNLMSIGQNRWTIKSVIYANPVAFICIISGFLLLMVFLTFWYSRYKLKSNLWQIQLQKEKESSQAKSEFLSQMSHEIRTPMNAVIGLTQIARRNKEVPEDVGVQLEQIEGAAQDLLMLINDILDMSKIESRKMKLNSGTFRLRLLMEQAESMMSVLAEKGELELELQYSLEHEYFVGDALRIKQVIINLLSNAIKFTRPGGRIVLSVSQLQEKETGAEILFSVEDNGVGIEKKDLELIFQSFEQGSGISRVGQGTGLGLSISHSLVYMMGGKLAVSSTPQRGSKFYFSLWLPFSEDIKEKQASSAYLEKPVEEIRILLAEDNELNVKIVVFILEAEGIKVERAADGQEAVDMFTAHPSGYYDLILMDIQMPTKSGLAATMEIRRMDRPDAKDIPIIAMTANTFTEDQEKAIEAGMNGFIPKPFKMELLYEIIGINLSHKWEKESVDSVDENGEKI